MDNVALVDAESYGSIIRLLLRLGWRIWVFLLASNNPFLSGYLNVVTEYMNAGRTAVSELMPWHVGDSIEAIPRPYKVEELERVHKQRREKPANYTGCAASWPIGHWLGVLET
jgi:hypothetical protein